MSPEIARPHVRPALLKPALGVLIASVAMTLVGQACAQDSASTQSQSIFGDRFNVNFGLGMAVLPRYMGADEYRSQVLPMLTVQRGIFLRIPHGEWGCNGSRIPGSGPAQRSTTISAVPRKTVQTALVPMSSEGWAPSRGQRLATS